ncbi:MAG: DUF302 domain-containing protein [Balneolaceae bacterium]|nr:DUF302 domain-containing protein [Balneolaceae bacterium]
MYRLTVLLVIIVVGLPIYSVQAQDGLVTVESHYPVEQTADRLQQAMAEKGLTIFERVNHHFGAESVNMELRPTVVLIFGNPKLGTPLMQCAPTVAVDLPQKMVVWEDDNGDVMIGYNDPDYLKQRHYITGCDAELNNIGAALKTIATAAAGK